MDADSLSQDSNHPPRTRNWPIPDPDGREWAGSGCSGLQDRHIAGVAPQIRKWKSRFGPGPAGSIHSWMQCCHTRFRGARSVVIVRWHCQNPGHRIVRDTRALRDAW